MPARVFGEIPGVRPGAEFADRRALHDSGVHRPLQAGISGAADEGADSIVISGGYEDDDDRGDTVIYTGHGGNDPATGKQIADQDLAAGNQALVTSHERGYPIRLVRGHQGDPDFSPSSGYRYDGLYDVAQYWAETGSSGHRIFRYELVRRERQGDLRIIPSPGDQADRPSVVVEAETASRGRQSKESPGVNSHIADVVVALELVNEATSVVSADINRSLREATEADNFARARELLDLAEHLAAFRDTAIEASKDWVEISRKLGRRRTGNRRPSKTPSRRTSSKTKRGSKRTRADYGKIAPGEKTSQSEYVIPLLQAVVDLGGSAKAGDVLDLLEKRMSPQFKTADLEGLASDPSQLRWRSTARWGRLHLTKDGLLRTDSPRGVWAISDDGREYLKASNARGR